MPKRIMEGNVVSNKMDKTVTVLVERRFLHPVYKKYVKHSSKFKAHDEANVCEMNERVQIQECVPLSKQKTWQVITGKAGEANKSFFETRGQTVKTVKQPETKKKATAKKATDTKSSTGKAASKADDAKKAPAKKTAAKKATAKKDTAKKSTSQKGKKKDSKS